MSETSASRTRRQNWASILKIAWPLIVANSFWNLQLTIDRVYLGHFSTEALAAAISVMGVFWTPMALLQQTASYVMTFVAQYFGAKREDMIGGAVWQSLYVCVVGGFLMLLLIPLAPAIFRMVGHSPSVQALEVEYFAALCYSAMPAALVAAVSGFYTGLGNTQIIIWINVVGLIANVIFDYVLIFGAFGVPRMGVAGAGYATALANWASAAFSLWLIFSKKYELAYKMRSSWKWNVEMMKRFIRFGLPSGMQWALEGLAFTVFLIIVGRMPNGDAGLASSGIVVTVMMLAVLPVLGIAQAVLALVGQHLGEKKPREAELAAWSGLQVSEMYILLISITFVLFPQFYLSWFHNEENAALWQQVSEMVPILLLFVATFIFFDTVNMVFSFSLKGAGDTRFVTLVALTIPWPIMVLPTYLMRDWENAVYWGWAAASAFSIAQAGVFTLRFREGKWKSMSVIGPVPT